MGDDLVKGVALATEWISGDIDSWAELAAMWIEQDALEVARELTVLIVQMATALALVEGPDCTTEIVLQQIAFNAGSGTSD
jgi:hypothetical protein